MKVDSNKMTVGDCVKILGRPWAAEHGIKSAEDLAASAQEEWAKLAQWVLTAQKSLAEGKEIVKIAEAKRSGRRR